MKYSLDRYSSKSGSVAACKHMKVGSQKLDEADLDLDFTSDL